jgi:uncharacterized protein YbjT (DUF2867 family)
VRSGVILVTGSTGNVGSNLVRELARAGAPTRALVHDAEKSPQIQRLGVETFVGSFEDEVSLGEALDGVERLYLLSPPGVEAMVEQQLRVLSVGKQMGVQYVVKQSSVCADEPTDASIIGAHRRIEEEIEASGLAWTHLRPNWFMQNELGQAGSVAGDGVFYAPHVTRVSMIDARDVAAVATHVLTTSGHEGKAYVLTGPASLSYEDVAAVYSHVLGRSVSWKEVSLEDARQSMLDGGLPDELASGFAEIMARYRSGGSTRDISPAVRQLLGREPLSFEQFVRDHEDAFAVSGAAVD